MARKRHGGREKAPKPPRETLPAAPVPSEAADSGGEGPVRAGAAWFAAALLIILGYFFLTKADPWGRNPWAVAAPACLLAGYLLIIPAIYYSWRGK